MCLSHIVLRSFGISGFSISGMASGDSRWYTFENKIRILGLGLRLTDVAITCLKTIAVVVVADY